MGKDFTADDPDGFLQEFIDRRDHRRRTLASLEGRLGLPAGFIFDLLKEKNDWAYIVKLAVLAEAALTSSLVLKIGKPQLYEHFSRINNSQRIDIALSMGLINNQDKRVLNVLSTVRNSFAHDVKNLTGSLASYIKALPQQRKLEILKNLVDFDGSGPPPPKITDDFEWLEEWFRILLDAAILAPLIALEKSYIDYI